MRTRKPVAMALAASLILVTGVSGQELYIHDIDNQLGTVDVSTGAVDVIGSLGSDIITDIAFDPLGNLFGLSYTSLYRINATTGATTFIGYHGVNGGNALVFGADGTLYGAGFGTTDLFSIDPTTGAGTSLGSLGAGVYSAGDLAFNGSSLFLSTTTDDLFRIVFGDLSSSSVVGPMGFSNVYGLATASDATLYGVSGTNIFSVNTTTGAGTLVRDYAGSGLGFAYGTSFFSEAGAVSTVPEPTTWLLMLTGLVGVGGMALRRREGLAG